MGDELRNVIHNLAEGLAASLLGLAGAWLNQWLQKRKKKFARPLETNGYKDRQIRKILYNLREAYGASRAYVSRYHNGETFLGGGGIFWKTRAYEVVRDGISYEASRFQRVLSTTMSEENDLVEEPGPGFRIVKDIPGGGFRFACEQAGVLAVARAAIRSKNTVIGFVGLDFDKQALDEHKFDAAHLDDLMDSAWRIAQLLPLS